MRVEADVQLAGGDVEIGGRYGDRDKLGYRWVLARDGRWTLLDMGRPWPAEPSRVLARRVAQLAARDERPHAPRHGRWQAADREDHAVRPKGMAFLASTYHRNSFDNLKVEPLGR